MNFDDNIIQTIFKIKNSIFRIQPFQISPDHFDHETFIHLFLTPFLKMC